MKVEIEDVDSCKKTLKIEILAEDVNAEFKKAYEEIRKNADVPGFRKGRAPRNIISMRFSEYIKAEVIDNLVPPAFEKAAEDAELEILRPPDAEDAIKPPFKELSVKENEPLSFEVTVDVKPEITIPDLEQLEIEKKEIDVPKEEVDDYLEKVREERADFIPVEDRPVQEGDYVALDVLATSDGDTLVEKYDETYAVGKIPEFTPHLIGMKPDDEKDFPIAFPEEMEVEHEFDQLAGKKVDFHIVLLDITEKHLPDLDDDFAKDMGEDNLERLVAKAWSDLIEFEKRAQRSKQEKDLITQLLEKSSFEVPEFLIEERANLRIRVDRYFESEKPEPTEEELEQYNSSALESIRTNWLLNEISENEEIEVSDEEVDAKIREIAQERDRDPEKYRKAMEDANRIEGFKSSMWQDKIFDLLIEKAAAKRTLIT